MQNEPGNVLDQFIAILIQLLDTVKTQVSPYLTKLSDLTGLSQDILMWGIFALVVLVIFCLFMMIRSLTKKSMPHDIVPEDALETSVDDQKTTKEDAPEPEDTPEVVPSTIEDTQNDEPQTGLLTNLRTGLSKTRKALSSKVDKLFTMGSGLDEDMLEELEELLITSDVGVETSMKLIESLSEKSSDIHSAEDLKSVIKEEIFSIIDVKDTIQKSQSEKPHVMMVVGVNGVGKTTTLGKLASRFVKEGNNVLIVAADTFRAAASDQLAVWADRSGAAIVRHKDNSDPAAVAFDGMEAALARKVDIVMIDTAGRLHTKKNLMEELKKIKRTVSSKMPGAPQETLMVVDGTTGQNALQQAKLFNDAIGISSIALTKLDGTAKGGIVIGISHTLNVPLKYIGVGEQVDDLQDFDPREYAEAML